MGDRISSGRRWRDDESYETDKEIEAEQDEFSN